jgi:AraC family transcriptional regulator of adaptative response / DNA-3-methyladenine glycosylase II
MQSPIDVTTDDSKDAARAARRVALTRIVTEAAPDPRYRVLVARDARFDGRLFIGVTSTGIYCRPVCRVRTPAQRHCRFFHQAAEAEAAGFRPCLRCRPELAPGLSRVDATQALGAAAAALIDEAVSAGRALPMATLAARLGVTDRHLRRLFAQTMGVSPKAYLDTRRLLLAKQLLTDTRLPMAEVAQAAGYASLRRLQATFLSHYRLNPSALRRQQRPSGSGLAEMADDTLVCRLGYRPPYDIAGVMRFLEDRAVTGVEFVDGLTWHRTLMLTTPSQGQAACGWIAARFDPERHEVEVTLSSSLQRALGPLLARVRQALDLDADPSRIDPVLACLHLPVLPGSSSAPSMSSMPEVPGVRVPAGVDGFETAVRVILGQQVTVAAARTLTGRLVSALGSPLATPLRGLTHLFPTAQQLAQASAEEIGRLGIVRQRVRALQAVAEEVASGRLVLDRSAALEPTLNALRALPGVGEWTVQVIAMRALAWPDAFPSTDIALLKALHTRDTRAAERQSAAWKPWRANAVMRLWQSLLSPPSDTAGASC